MFTNLKIFFSSIIFKKSDKSNKKSHNIQIDRFSSLHALDKFNYLYYQGHSILYKSQIKINNTYYDTDILINKKKQNISNEIFNYIHSFEWLRDLYSLQTNDASKKAYEILNIRLSSYGNNANMNPSIWNPDLIAKRAYHTILTYSMLPEYSVYKKQVNKFILSHVDYILQHWKTLKYNLSTIKVITLIVYTHSEEYAYLKESLLKAIMHFLESHIHNDGAPFNQEPSTAINILVDLLEVYTCINKLYEEKEIIYIRSFIDRITLFIRSLRHLDGSLMIFNSSIQVSKKKIDYILSYSNIPSQYTMSFEKGGFYIIKAKDLLFGLNANNDNHIQELLSFEASIENTKIITNLSYSFKEESIANNGGLTVYKNNQPIKWMLPYNDNCITNNKKEESWKVLNTKAKYIKGNLEILYKKTIFLSRKKGKQYLIVEDKVIPSNSKGLSINIRFYLDKQIVKVQKIFNDTHKYLLYNERGQRYILKSENGIININHHFFMDGDKHSNVAMFIVDISPIEHKQLDISYVLCKF